MLERDEAGELRYALRVSADVLGSDGSRSMASVCAGSLALMGCGAPIREAVAGVAMGLISDDAAESAEEPRDLILTDILGAEDRFGDLDMKVAGPRDGVTACEMDTSVRTASPCTRSSACSTGRATPAPRSSTR